MAAEIFFKSGFGRRVRQITVAAAQAAGLRKLAGNIYSSLPETPTIKTAPTIAGAGGATAVGTVFTLTPGAYNGQPAPTLSYQWTNNGSDIGGETAETLDTTGLSPGDLILCVVTATNGSGTLVTNSNVVALS